MTLADLAFAATYATMKSTGHLEKFQVPELSAWYEKVSKEIPNFDKVNTAGANIFGDFYKSKVTK